MHHKMTPALQFIIVQLASIGEHVYLKEYPGVVCDWKGILWLIMKM